MPIKFNGNGCTCFPSFVANGDNLEFSMVGDDGPGHSLTSTVLPKSLKLQLDVSPTRSSSEKTFSLGNKSSFWTFRQTKIIIKIAEEPLFRLLEVDK